MSLEVNEKERYIFITYARRGFADVEQFKAMLSSIKIRDAQAKDVILDLSSCRVLTSPEIGAIVWLSNTLSASPRIIRIIPSEELFKQLSSINIPKLANCCLYKNRKDFEEQIKGK
jgi:hypothetical protein